MFDNVVYTLSPYVSGPINADCACGYVYVSDTSGGGLAVTSV